MTRNAQTERKTTGPALSSGDCAVLACLWEVAAAKPGNVYRGADFENVTFADFATSAGAIRAAMDSAAVASVGATVLAAIGATRSAVGSNTNLGIVLLLAPLAAVEPNETLTAGLPRILANLSVDDTIKVYQAIRLAKPGGLGSVAEADVCDDAAPTITLRAAMELAADYDLVARQYVNEYRDVWQTSRFLSERARNDALEDAIVRAYLDLLSRTPDTLIARKCGLEVAQEASRRAAQTLQCGEPGEAPYLAALADLDFWLRSDGHRRNPGATADVVAAALYLLLRERQIDWPIKFYRS